MKQLAVIDQPEWPKFKSPSTPALMSFRVVWKATNEPADFNDPIKQFHFEGFNATAQLEATVEVPSLNFSWKSDPIETSNAKFAVIGREVNGRYYTS